MEERGDLANQVKTVRRKAGLTQQELADEVGVSRQTIGNLESGATIPQHKTLVAILDRLGIEPRAAEFSDKTTRWLAVVGGIMDSLPEERRDKAGQAAVEAVTQELVASANVSGVGEDTQDDYRLAAKRRSEDRGEDYGD